MARQAFLLRALSHEPEHAPRSSEPPQKQRKQSKGRVLCRVAYLVLEMTHVETVYAETCWAASYLYALLCSGTLGMALLGGAASSARKLDETEADALREGYKACGSSRRRGQERRVGISSVGTRLGVGSDGADGEIFESPVFGAGVERYVCYVGLDGARVGRVVDGMESSVLNLADRHGVEDGERVHSEKHALNPEVRGVVA
ncbi:hypothetical protein E4U26_006034 [Claviceps purpurea]|nr:hypothetical protein E4U26_006034 [Claviceps purpurea]